MQPTDARTLAYVGGCHLDANPPQILEARAYFERAVAADPNSGVAQKGLAIIAQHRGDAREFALRLAECNRGLLEGGPISDYHACQLGARSPTPVFDPIPSS